MMSPTLSPRWARLSIALGKFVVVPVVLGLAICGSLRSAPDFPANFGAIHVLAAAVAYQLCVFANSFRLRALVRSFGGALSIGASHRINLMAHLYFFVFMTGAAMEAVRLFMLRQYGTGLRSGDLVTTLVLDRLLGALASGVMLAIAAIGLAPRFLNASQTAFALLGGLLCVLAAAVALYFIPIARPQIVRTRSLLLQSWTRVAVGFLQGALANLLVAAGVFVVTWNLGMSVGFARILWAAMAGQVLMLIPVSLFGIGPAELGGAALLALVGTPPTEAFIVIFLIYVMRISAALAGLLLGFWEDGVALLERNLK
jgi:uncharacterized membrane protein YbhN (UPF0104 family)